MSIRHIELLGSEVLRREAEPVEDFDDELKGLVRDMFETMYYAKGAGLAAPQIGVSKRVLVFDVKEEEGEEAVLAIVNPVIVESSSDTEKSLEGCLSIPGVEELVTRPAWVSVDGFTPDGESLHIEGEGMVARVLQHEIDHLDGVLFFDRISALKRKMLIKKYKKMELEGFQE